MERLVEGGVRNVVVINLAPSGPTFGCPADDPLWFSDEWWAIFRSVCEHARTLGVGLWFYDQLGFSGANVAGGLLRDHPEFTGEQIECLTHDGPSACALEVPAGGRLVGVSVLPLDDAGEVCGPPTALASSAHGVDWPGGARARVVLAYARPDAFDLLDPTAAASLLDAVHGEFDKRVPDLLGNPIVGSFQDELPRVGTWSRSFTEAFRSQHGYDLDDVVAALWQDWGTDSQRIRGDYHATRTALAEAAFFRPLYEWHEVRGLMAACDQQSPARAGHPVGGAQLYGEYLATHRWFSAPGSDHMGDTKVHSSLAHLYERPRTWLEAFHSSGWGATPEEIFDWLLPWLRAGATLFDPHAVYYSTRGGWFEWAPPSTCWRQPYWPHYRVFADTVSRLCAVLAQGAHVCDIAVLYPSATTHAHLRADRPLRHFSRTSTGDDPASRAEHTYLQLVGRMNWWDTQPGILDDDQRDFDVLDEDSLRRARVEEGRLCIADEAYRVVILPALDVLPSECADVLRAFCESGGLVLAVGGLPRSAAGRAGDDDALATLRGLVDGGGVIAVESVDDVPAALGVLPRRVAAPVPSLLRRVGDEHVLFLPASHPNATTHPIATRGRGIVDYDFRPERHAAAQRIVVADIPGHPTLWDPTDGSRRALATTALDDGRVAIDVPMTSLPAALIVWEKEPGTVTESSDVAAPGTRRELTGPWDCEPLATAPDVWGDLTLPVHSGASPLRVWQLDHRPDTHDVGLDEGWGSVGWSDADSVRVRATYGRHALTLGPAAVSDLPAPLGADEARAVATGAAELGATRWTTAEYSPARGIDHDDVHVGSLGPKGFVPDEFLRWPMPEGGEGVQVRVIVTGAAAGPARLAVGAAAAKQLWWNGEPLPADPGGYVHDVAVDVQDGANVLEIRLVEPDRRRLSPLDLRPPSLRAFWALHVAGERFRRPEWIQPATPGPSGSTYTHSADVELGDDVASAHLVIGTAGDAAVDINGATVGRLPSTGYYEASFGGMPSVFRYDVSRYLRRGRNAILVSVREVGAPTPVAVDLVTVAADGTTNTWSSGADWLTARDGHDVGTALVRQQWYSSRFAFAAPRPHALPQARWLESGDVPDSVYDVIASTSLRPAVDWFRFGLPPGAVAVELPVLGDARCFVDGVEREVTGGRVEVTPCGGAADCVVRIASASGLSGAALWVDAPRVVLGRGRIEVGDWQHVGLAGYSGGLRYRREIELDAAGRVLLDLGGVRGTAEVFVNGTSCGVRVFSPWTFDVTPAVRPGRNLLEIDVFNTLGPYLGENSPTAGVYPSQRVSGLLGPVTVRMNPADSR